MAPNPPNHPMVQRVRWEIGTQGVAPSEIATSLIRELAESQHGIVARRQLIGAGLGRDLIRERVRSGRLVIVHRGVFAVGHGRISLHGEWMAAALACGPGAYLSHGSAAHLWGMRRSRRPHEVIRVAGHRRPHGIWLHQTRSLPAEDVTIEAGIPVTSIERTVMDQAGRLEDRQIEQMLVAAERSRRLDWRELQRIIEQGNGRKGLRRLRRVAAGVDTYAADAVSPLEVDFLSLCRKANLPFPQVNVLVEGYLVDFYWPNAKTIVETDGYAFHSDRPAFEKDHESTVALTAAGYKVHRATYRMLKSNPRLLLRLLRKDVGVP
jgi:uncharacterized protein DUF559/putative AbiEi antitoxin of type IV toxin-antitoxin system